MEIFDVIVIGGGPGGYNAAAYASANGLSVLLFEKDELGGVCLNEGCVPSKTLLNSAKVLNGFLHGNDFGVDFTGDGKINAAAVVDRKNRVVKRLVAGVRSKLKSAGVTVLKEKAYIEKKEGEFFKVSGTSSAFLSKYLIIATGSHAFIPDIEGMGEAVENGFALTNKEILNLTEVPGKLLIMGGGVIGLEMADYFNAAGAEVTIVEMLPKIAGATDNAVSAVLKKALEKKGITFLLGTKVTKIKNGAVTVSDDDGERDIAADKVLVSVGRRANVSGSGIENIGLSVEKGAIVTDEKMRTDVKNVYAVGDVNGKVMLAHAAYREGEVAVNDILGKNDAMNYGVIPSVIYTYPEVASVGYTAKEARAAGINADEISLSLMYSGRYIAENTDYTGIMKLVYDKDEKTLIGASVAGSYASEYIVAVSDLINLKVPLERVKKLVYPHPTVCEVIREGVFEIKQ